MSCCVRLAWASIPAAVIEPLVGSQNGRSFPCVTSNHECVTHGGAGTLVGRQCGWMRPVTFCAWHACQIACYCMLCWGSGEFSRGGVALLLCSPCSGRIMLQCILPWCGGLLLLVRAACFSAVNAVLNMPASLFTMFQPGSGTTWWCEPTVKCIPCLINSQNDLLSAATQGTVGLLENMHTAARTLQRFQHKLPTST